MDSRPVVVPHVPPVNSKQLATEQFLKRFADARAVIVKVLRASSELVNYAVSAPGPLFQVELPKEVLDGLAEGVLQWSPRTDGTMPAVIRDVTNNSIQRHVSLRRVDVATAGPSLTNLAIQSALADVIAKLEDIQEGVVELIAGARADRHGLVRGGYRLYAQAMAMSPGQDRRTAILNAAQTLEMGRSQLLENVDAQLGRLKAPGVLKAFSSGLKFFGESATDKLARNFRDVEHDFRLCLAATQWSVLAHEELGHPRAARVAIDQLARVAVDVVPKAIALAGAVPYRQDDDPGALWVAASERLLPCVASTLESSSDASTGMLVAIHRMELTNG